MSGRPDPVVAEVLGEHHHLCCQLLVVADGQPWLERAVRRVALAAKLGLLDGVPIAEVDVRREVDIALSRGRQE